MVHLILTKLNFFLRRANNIKADLEKHENDEDWYKNNKETVKSEIKSLRTDLMWLLDFIEKGD